MKIIAIANQKGGVGKTTVALALATALAYTVRQKTLLVDLDTQANATLGLRQKPAPGVAEWLMLGKPLKQVVVHVRGLLDLVPSNSLTEETALMLATRSRVQAVKEGLNGAGYRFVILDCPPSLSMISRAGLFAADHVLVPVDCESFALAGLPLLATVIKEVQEAGSKVRLLAVLPNKLRSVKVHDRTLAQLVKLFGDKRVWPPLPLTIQIPAAQELGQSLWDCPEVDKHHRAAWYELVKRVVEYA